MGAPYEIICNPLTVYLAPVGTAMPAVNAAPSGSWFKLGTSGAKNYDEKGVTVEHDQTIGKFTPAAGTVARKAYRTAEDLKVVFDLVDMTIEQYAMVLNNASVTTAAGPPAIKSIPLQQGLTVATFALLCRGVSPISDALPAQYQVPIVYQEANPTVVYSKGAPAALACEFHVLDDLTNGSGLLVIQTA